MGSTGDEVLAIARRLGYRFSAQEEQLLTSSLNVYGELFAVLDQLPIPEAGPPLHFPERRPGWTPPAEENPYNAFITRCEIRGSEDGRLAGKTVAFKDHTAVAGIRLTLGSHILEDYTPEFDATIVARVLDEGATVVGKLNMEPFSGGVGTCGAAGTAGRRPFGRVQNPHDPARSAGGSSSGSGAAAAAGLVDIAFGGDQGGSIRAPSSWCGALGLKPTHGLVPHTGVFGYETGADHVGPMTRTTEDLALALECVAGTDGYDPRQARVLEPRDYTTTLDHGVRGLRIGVLQEGFGKPGSDPNVEATVQAAVETFASLGAELHKVSVPAHDVAPAPLVATILSGFAHETNFGGVLPRTFNPTSFVRAIGEAKARHADDLPLLLRIERALAAYMREQSFGSVTARAENMRPAIIEAYDAVLRTVDLLVMPTLPITAPVFEEPRDDEHAVELDITGGSTNLLSLAANTAPFDFTGHPALSIPCGKVAGLPVGMQLVGRRFDEETLLRAAYAFQHASAWDRIIAVELPV